MTDVPRNPQTLNPNPCCVHICIYIYIHIYIYIYIYIHVHLSLSLSLYIYIYIDICIYTSLWHQNNQNREQRSQACLPANTHRGEHAPSGGRRPPQSVSLDSFVSSSTGFRVSGVGFRV